MGGKNYIVLPRSIVINGDTSHILMVGLPPIEMWSNSSNSIPIINDCFTHITSILGS